MLADQTAVAIKSSVLATIGNTPLVEMSVNHQGARWRFLAKLEFMNPTGSIKDRIARYIIEHAEARGELRPGSVIVEATSGNTGIALAMVAAVKGYRLIVVMPEHMSRERRRIMSFLGAELCLTPTIESFAGARLRAEAMAGGDPKVFLPRQFQNPDNVMCHYQTTGQEIVAALGECRIDALVAGVGTGGTLMGVGQRLRELTPECRLVAVEPAEAAILSGCKRLVAHQIAGIGDGFVPELLDVQQLDWVEAVPSADAVVMAKHIALEHGMMVGVSSGANVLATINVLRRLGPDARVVTVLPDRAERYFSTELFAQRQDEIVRACRQNCENPFCEFRTTI